MFVQNISNRAKCSYLIQWEMASLKHFRVQKRFEKVKEIILSDAFYPRFSNNLMLKQAFRKNITYYITFKGFQIQSFWDYQNLEKNAATEIGIMLVAKILNMGMGSEIDEELKKYFFDFWKVIRWSKVTQCMLCHISIPNILHCIELFTSRLVGFWGETCNAAHCAVMRCIEYMRFCSITALCGAMRPKLFFIQITFRLSNFNEVFSG